MKRIAVAVLMIISLGMFNSVLACTTMLVGKNASYDGSVMVSHSDDGLNDGSMVYVPAMDHKPGTMRAVYYSHAALDFKPQWGATVSHRIVTKV